MNNNKIIDGVKTAFIDENHLSSETLKPTLIVNNLNSKVLNSIKDELNNCDEFYISVAFITMSGLTPLLQDLKKIESQGIKGKILTTDYLNFTEPKALKKLDSLNNIEVKLYSNKKDGFHTKGYIFRKNNIYKAIVGSSNLTMNALTINKEWNIGFSSLNEGEMIKNLLKEFQVLWNEASSLKNILSNYEVIYENNKHFTKTQKIHDKTSIKENLVPNSMQKKFLHNLRELIKKGEKKALLISATGTGKTYAAAFAAHDYNPTRFLFLVHREQIAKQALQSFKKIFKKGDFGLLTGNNKDYNSKYLFSTVQTMSKIYESYKRTEFDYIIIDEVHRAGATSYLKLLNHFKPSFTLGMTASPNRNDEINIYELFDYNIAMDIRLQDALEEDLLCPFHYFGITDDIGITEHATPEGVNELISKSQYYNYSGDKIKALVFCSNKKEAKKLATMFTKKGHLSHALTGEDSQKIRETTIDKLVNDNLEYIFTVDIFNEGVDIPEINQVLLIRPTQSSIIFIQQLGRGLRKSKNKEYVVILDFIGNYKNNFLIPIALSGDYTYDKDNIRKYLMESNKIIPGASTINFDEISKEKIYESINNTNFSKINLFKEKYQNLKYKLGRVPYLLDFYTNNELDPLLILNHNSFDCYNDFLFKVDKDHSDDLNKDEIKSLKFISDNFANGKRKEELYILKLLSLNKKFSFEKLQELGCNNKDSFNSALNIFNLKFFSKNDLKKYSGIKFFNKDYSISTEFNKFLKNPSYLKHFSDVLNFALEKSKEYTNNLTLYKKYSRKDICRLLNWPKDESSTIYGYRVKHGTCPIFVTYNKNEDISESTKYQDEFLSHDIFSWMTRSKVTLESKEAIKIQNSVKTGLKIHLFIKKSDDEGKDFYYLGEVTPFESTETTIENDKGDKLPIVNFKYKLKTPVKDELYDYFKKTLSSNTL